MIRMNESKRGLLDTCIMAHYEHDTFRDLRRHRMTYECAGLLFRAMMLDVHACSQVALADIDRMGLQLPEVDLSFAAFIDENADRLQLFDEPISAYPEQGEWIDDPAVSDGSQVFAVTKYKQMSGKDLETDVPF
jgi:hypothetical protein